MATIVENTVEFYKIVNNIVGTFICNSDKERRDLGLEKCTVSIWTVVNSNREPYVNPLYKPSKDIIIPSCKMKDLVLWYNFPSIFMKIKGKNTTCEDGRNLRYLLSSNIS